MSITHIKITNLILILIFRILLSHIMLTSTASKLFLTLLTKKTLKNTQLQMQVQLVNHKNWKLKTILIVKQKHLKREELTMRLVLHLKNQKNQKL